MHFHPLTNDFVFTALTQAKTGGITVGLGVFAKVREASVSIPRPLRSLRIDFVQEIKYCSHGRMQAVEIEPVETNPLGMSVLIVIAQPTDKIENISIAPHPCRESPEARKRVDCIFVFTLKPNKLIYAIGVWPVRFYSNCGEVLFRDQALSDLRAEAIELMVPCEACPSRTKRESPIILNKGSKSVVSPVSGCADWRIALIRSCSCFEIIFIPRSIQVN